MEDTRFDTIARNLAQATSRRRAIGGVLGATFAMLMGQSALAKRGRIRRGRRGGHGQDDTTTASDVPLEGVVASGVWEETLDMCHYDPETGGYRIVPVSTVEVPDRLNRGDTLYIDCCVFTDCVSTECLTAKECVSGACSFDVAVNASCDLGNGVFGICRSDAVCVEVSS
jgi:hypothetical protein